MAIFNGTSGANTINGTSGDDQINGLGGNDHLDGGKGNDTVDGGDGNDEISGGAGNDILIGGLGLDEMYGDAGDDTMSGGANNDTMYGAAGNDTMDGGDGDDTIGGDQGNDIIKGGLGVDHITGDAGNDTIEGGAGNDVIDGGQGTDIAVYSDVESAYVVTRDRTGKPIKVVGPDGTDTLVNIEQLKFDLRPVAHDDGPYSTAANTPINITSAQVLANDTQGDGAGVLAVVAGSAVGGSVSFAAGKFTFTPNSGFSSAGSFQYSLTDTDGDASTAKVSINVAAGTNTPPTISAPASASTNEDIATGALAVTIGDLQTPPGSLVLTAHSSDQSVVTDANIVLGGSGANRTVTITPVANANGPATITLTVNDGSGGSASTNLALTVQPVNDAPSYTLNTTTTTVNKDSGAANIAGVASGFSPGPANESAQTLLSYNVTSNSNAGLFSVAPTLDNAGVLHFTPTAGATGTAVVAFAAKDSGGVANGGVDTSAPHSITINVQAPANTPPTIVPPGPQTVNEDSAATAPLAFTIGDIETAAGSLVVTAHSSDQSVIADADIILGGSGAGRTVTVKPVADHNGSATITLTVSDGGGGSTPANFVVTVNPVNDAPSFTLSGSGGNINNTAGDVTISNLVSNFSPGPANESSQTLLASIVSNNSNPSLFTTAPYFDASGVLHFDPAPGAVGQDVISIIVQDSGGTTNGGVDISAEHQFFLNVQATNAPPTITPPTAQTINEDTNSGAIAFTIGDTETAATALTVTAHSSDQALIPDASIILGGSDTNRTVAFTPGADLNGAATITLTVTDGGNAHTEGVFNVTVNPVNDAPSFTLSGSGGNINNTAGDVTISNLVSNFSPGPANESSQTLLASIVSNNSNPSLFTTAPYFDASGVLHFDPAPGAVGQDVISIIVQDSGGTTNGGVDISAEHQFFLNVQEPQNLPPVINSNGGGDTASISVVEGVQAVTTVSATDPESAPIAYSISGGADSDDFLINGTNGALTFAQTTDFNAPTDSDANNTYEVIVQASDGVHTDAQTITVTVLDDSNSKPLFTSSNAFSVTEAVQGSPSSPPMQVVATDADSGQTITYSLTGGTGNDDNNRFNIDPVTGALTFKNGPNFEAPNDTGLDNVYNVRVRATDNGAIPEFREQAITVTVTNANDDPAFTSPNAFVVSEDVAGAPSGPPIQITASDPDLPAQGLTFSLSNGAGDDDKNRFNIDPVTGVLTFKNAPNFENPTDVGADNVYNVRIKVTDDGSPAQNKEQAITVTVTNANDAPTITSPNTFTVSETTATAPSTPTITITATDPDSPAQGLTYSLAGGANNDDNNRVNIDPVTGVITFKGGGPDFEQPTDANHDNIYLVRVGVTDNGSPAQAKEMAISINVTDVNGESPKITSPGNFNVVENNTAVGSIVASVESGDAFSYSLLANNGPAPDSTKFSINPTTGALSFLVAPDFEAPTDADHNNDYVIRVRVTDSTASLNDTQTVTVHVQDAAESMAARVVFSETETAAAPVASDNFSVDSHGTISFLHGPGLHLLESMSVYTPEIFQ